MIRLGLGVNVLVEILDGEVVTAPDNIRAHLQAIIEDLVILTGGDPDYRIGHELAPLLGGRVIDYQPPAWLEEEYNPDVFY